MKGWIEEQGTVIASDASGITVRVERRSTCSRCSARSGCGNGVLAQVLGRRDIEFQLPANPLVRSGDSVVLGIRDHALVSGAFAVYLLPLLGMLVPPVIWTWLQPDAHELSALAWAVVGFIVTLLGVKRWLQRQSLRYHPVLLDHPALRKNPFNRRNTSLAPDPRK